MSHERRFDRDYGLTELREADLPADPLVLFRSWLEAAAGAGIVEPHAMALATADADGAPSCRMVLMRTCDARGLDFYTNYQSRKGRELDANPRAAATFWWPSLERQVRFEGRIERVAPAESDAYFASRPRGAQLASAASPQSRPLADRRELEERIVELERRCAGGDVPRPEHWGGYRLVPSSIEFWQGRASRAHDRIVYARGSDGTYRIVRLAP
jgi:pyridoxamine 5'-phosphate oxidase